MVDASVEDGKVRGDDSEASSGTRCPSGMSETSDSIDARFFSALHQTSEVPYGPRRDIEAAPGTNRSSSVELEA